MSQTQYTPGRFVWRELMTRDLPRARSFYTELFGWQAKEVDMGPMGTYVLFESAGKQIAGLWNMMPGMEAPPFWTSYVSVNDVDASAAKAKQLGGQLYVEPQDIPNVGRFSMIADADGAVFAVFRGSTGDPIPAVPQPGEFCWETLVTNDISRATKFYTEVVGWKPSNGTGMLTFGSDEKMENQHADVHEVKNHPSHWATYVVVAKLEEPRDRAEKLGAKILEPLIEIPGIGRISYIQDPTGAAIGLYETARR